MNCRLAKIVSILFIMILGVSLAGCGKKEPENTVSQDAEYGALYEKLSFLQEKESAGQVDMVGDNLYVLATKWSDDYERCEKTSLYKYNINSKKSSVITYIQDDAVKSMGISGLKVYENGESAIVYSSWDRETYEMSYEVYYYDANGNVKFNYSLTDILEGESGNTFSFDSKGNLLISAEQNVYLVGSDGALKFKLLAGDWVNGSFVDKEDNFWVSVWTQGETVTKKLDVSTKTLGDKIDISTMNGNLIDAGNNIFAYCSSDNVQEYNKETGEKNTLWSWLDFDISDVYYDRLYVGTEGAYYYINSDYSEEDVQLELITFKKGITTSENEKETITLACFTLSWSIKDYIIDFNKHNDKYRIKVTEYYDDNDYEGALARFNADLASADKADIVLLSSENFMNLAKKGAFADLGKLMKKDKSFNRADYFENILDAMKVDGKEYFVMPTVRIVTMIGSKDIFANKNSWTIQDMVALRKQYPDISFIEYPEYESAFYTALFYSADTFIDFEKGTCNFLNDDFYNLLEYAKTFPKKLDYENYDSWEEIMEGNVLFSEIYLYSADDFSMYNQLYKNGTKVIGIPMTEGSGHVILPQEMFAISVKSKKQEQAWEILKDMISEEAYKSGNNDMGFPILKSAFYDKMKESMKVETYIDENGVEQEVSHGGISTGTILIELKAPTQAEVDELTKIVETADKIFSFDERVFEIVEEEAKPFFEGQKSAKEVAEIMQSRVGIYLAENN